MNAARSSAYRWFPWYLMAALAVVAVVNGALAYLAIHSSTGLVTEHPYELGTGYNRILARAAAQDALGWKGEVSFVAGASHGGRVVLSVTDAAGRPVTGLAIDAVILRPVEPLPPKPLALEAQADGRYGGNVTLERPGQWEVRVAASKGADTYDFAARIFRP